MEKGTNGADFFRPPPTSPRGRPKKKARREGPPRPRDGGPFSRPPISPRPGVECSRGEKKPRDSKPLQLGGYVIQQGPSASPEFKIRGRSFPAPKSEAGCDSDPEVTAWVNLDRDFTSAVNSIYDNIQEIESVGRESGYPTNHPVFLAAIRIRSQLNQLHSVYHGIGVEVEGMAHDLDQFAAREEALRRELDESRTANFKLTCAKADLTLEVNDLKTAAGQTEARLRRLKRESEELEARCEKLRNSNRELQQECEKITAEKLELKGSIRAKDEGMQVEKAESRRLQSLVQEKDAEVEGLKSANCALQRLILERDQEIEKEKADRERLHNLIREKEAQVASLPTGPITPQSPLAATLSAPLPTASIIQTPSQHILRTPPVSSDPYIKREPPDPTSSPSIMPQESVSVEHFQDPVQRVHILSTGVANLLGRMFHIDREVTYNDVLIVFLSSLGAIPEAFSINTTQAAGFWELKDPWTPNPIAPPELPPSLEERFALLCLLFPFPGNQTQLQDHEAASTFTLLNHLLNSLIKADYSACSRAGLAFLQAMYAVHPLSTTLAATTAATSPSSPQETLTTRTALLAIMLCELCRALEHTYWPTGPCPKRRWDIGSILGAEAQDAAQKLPIGWLAAALRDAGAGDGIAATSGGVTGGCGDRFCFFSMPQSTGTGDSGSDNKEMGLLHCGESSCDFLVMDFEERSLRLVDCRLAWMRPNEAEPRKLDLIVSRPVAGEGGEQAGEELMRVEAAPRDVAAFWLRYALEDV
ncbi:hypothetical protein C8A03DRAFT_14821 [Achaetomium macrosporum]|uniref:Uncharacterized protein n=1 Tax=Achaetomium macrosporum TaxID=79813 RepID=A0AAN7CC16_9PEZI|nr:hypothetical protein C8A03DRAFT_14821 [Achaetomium macrosporum]